MLLQCSFLQEYNRRSSRVIESERELWQDVKPTMMSDEDVGKILLEYIHRIGTHKN